MYLAPSRVILAHLRVDLAPFRICSTAALFRVARKAGVLVSPPPAAFVSVEAAQPKVGAYCDAAVMLCTKPKASR